MTRKASAPHQRLSSISADHGNRLFEPSANLTMHVLPLLRGYLETHVWLRRDLWPEFDSAGVALGLKEGKGVEVLQTYRARLLRPPRGQVISIIVLLSCVIRCAISNVVTL